MNILPTKTWSTILISSVLALSACKSKASEPSAAPAAATTAPAAPASAAKPVEAAPVAKPAEAPVAQPQAAGATGSVDPLSVPAVAVSAGKKNKGPGQTLTVSFEDPTSAPHKSITACPGDKLAVVVPARDSSWTVVKADAALGKAKEDVVDGWLGPGTDGAKFTWVTKETNEYTIVLEEKETHEKVAVELSVFGCDE